ncbi:MAG: restriction endonuclease subunit S [Prevotella sp.]|jgi:hypothetical protein|nr:restriction endonuclease subunit S [Prevotella sp.]
MPYLKPSGLLKPTVKVWMMKKLNDLFDITYGVNLELNALIRCTINDKYAVKFVSRTSKNNGISAIVEKRADVDPIPSGTITVAMGGSVLETFLQSTPYYSGRDIIYLTPKVEMSEQVKLYYCACIRVNKYRYNYGRQANKTIKDILIPDISEIPEYVFQSEILDYSNLKNSLKDDEIRLFTKNWKKFRYDDLFNIKKGKRVTKVDMIQGNTPFISATDENNGIREYSGLINLFPSNTITVSYNGSVGEAFYQEQPYWASDDINILYPKFKLNKFIAMFIITIIRSEKYRFNYGRKWHKERMDASIIKLPVMEDNSPDWSFMEKYIKSLPYSYKI